MGRRAHQLMTAMHGAVSEETRFRFQGVRARVFPLRAREAALQRVCDRYLNLCPDEVSFRPAAPYVLLAMLDYSRMSYAASGAHRGWVSQQEVCFCVPLAWGRVARGQWRALGAAVVTPFVFVDQPRSVELGRQIYGWPKLPAEILQGLDAQTSASSAGHVRVASLAVESFAPQGRGAPRFDATDSVDPHRVGGVEPLRAGGLDPHRARGFDTRRSSGVSRLPLAPLVEVERMAPEVGSLLGRRLGDLWMGPGALWREVMRLASSGHRDAADALPWLRQVSRSWSRGRLPAYYTANLKQVRSLEDSSIASYQAVTMAPLEMTTLHRAGVLGERRVALGDPSGGYRVQVDRDPRFPIVETLGLVGSSSSDGERSTARDRAGGAPAATTLLPLFPFWVDADFEYGRGTAALWRSPHRLDSAWHRRSTTSSGAASSIVVDARSAIGDRARAPWFEPSRGARTAPPYADPVGGGAPSLTGARTSPRFDPTWGARMVPAPPYAYPQLAVRVLALPATQHLAAVVTGWKIPLEAGRLRVLDAERPCVLMVVSTRAHASRQGAGSQRHQVAFLVPVIWTHAGVETVALVSALAFADSSLAAMVAHELGPEVTAAQIDLRPGSWLGPTPGGPLLSLATDALAARDGDAEVEQRALVEVIARDLAAAGSLTTGEGDMRFCIIGRRRIRDATVPEAFAYEEWFSQHLVVRGGPPAWRRGAKALEVQIHRSPEMLDVVGRLALEVDREHGDAVTVAASAFAFATLDVMHERNTSLAVRVDDGPWTAPTRSHHDVASRLDDTLARWLARSGAAS